jgi:hypothetical protein
MHIYPNQQQLLDVPRTFSRPTLIYQQLIASIAGALTSMSQAASALSSQEIYQNAIVGWNDVWGDLSGILRQSGESDETYHARLPNMLLAARDSTVAIQTWLQVIENVVSSISENIPSSTGYSIEIYTPITAAQLQLIISRLAYVRPAGVPFTAGILSVGTTFLGTVNYYGTSGVSVSEGRVTGSYLAAQRIAVSGTTPGPSTPNQVSTLPDLLLTDLTLNPPA